MPTQTSVNNEFRNNLTVSESTAGTTAAVTIYNSDNSNAASNASVKVTTGGASAGDAFLHLTNSVVDVTIGLDNSDSDAFVISKSTTPGTTNVAKCVTTGEWVYPLQPGFNATKTGGAANVTGNAAQYTIVCDSERWDQNADFNTGTGTFTAPVTGKYLLTMAGYLEGMTVNRQIQIIVVTTARTFNIYNRRPNSALSASAGGSVIVAMTAADTAIFKILGNGEAGNTEDLTSDVNRIHFSGVLLQ